MNASGNPASSEDLHPTSGARFVFTREENIEPPRYVVVVYLPESRSWRGTLQWSDDRANLEASAELAPDDAWTLETARALARVLKRDPKRKLIRWRAER